VFTSSVLDKIVWIHFVTYSEQTVPSAYRNNGICSENSKQYINTLCDLNIKVKSGESYSKHCDLQGWRRKLL